MSYVERLTIPKFLKNGVVHLVRGYSDNYVSIGYDTETFQGPPITMQFTSKFLNIRDIVWLGKENPLAAFIDFLLSLPKTEKVYIFWGHNLRFDVLSLFYENSELLLDEQIEIADGELKITGLYAQLTFLNVFRNGRQIACFRDTWAYYRGTLDALSELHCREMRKLEKPDGLGEKMFFSGDKIFEEYALRDSEIAERVGDNILFLHKQYDIPLTVSLPDFAAKVYKKHFLRDEHPRPEKTIEDRFYWSDHGGKNVFTGSPGLHKDIYSLDICSAYPWAMTQLPGFGPKGKYVCGSWDELREVFGCYCVTGHVHACKWPVFFDHRIKGAMEPVFGDVVNLWVTGAELKEALDSGEFDLKKSYGYAYIPWPGEDLPLKRFAEHFFEKKNTAKSKIERETNKLILNSLSGKFSQSRPGEYTEYSWDDGEKILTLRDERIAGGLFHAPIASAIKGLVRAKIHRLEHKYKSLHTATDGIFTSEKPDKNDLGTGLGDLKLEGFGDLYVLRNKLYVFKAKDGEILKVARHGFRGTPEKLIEMVLTGETEYDYVRCNTLKESRRSKLVPNKFETRHGTITLKGE